MTNRLTSGRFESYGQPHLRNHGVLRIGEGVRVKASPVTTIVHVNPGATLIIGDRVMIGQGANITAHLLVEIGDDVRVGDFASIVDTDFHTAADHRVEGEPAPIRIGKKVEIGAHASVLRGSRIGEGARIEPGSLVFGAVAAGAHVGGNPARVLAKAAGQGETETPLA